MRRTSKDRGSCPTVLQNRFEIEPSNGLLSVPGDELLVMICCAYIIGIALHSIYEVFLASNLENQASILSVMNLV